MVWLGGLCWCVWMGWGVACLHWLVLFISGCAENCQNSGYLLILLSVLLVFYATILPCDSGVWHCVCFIGFPATLHIQYYVNCIFLLILLPVLAFWCLVVVDWPVTGFSDAHTRIRSGFSDAHIFVFGWVFWGLDLPAGFSLRLHSSPVALFFLSDNVSYPLRRYRVLMPFLCVW